MTAWDLRSFSILVVACFGCSNSVHAATSRYLAPDGVAIPFAPVCFAPVNAGSGLAAQANAEHIQTICEAAARNQGVMVVPFWAPSCAAAAKMSWESKYTGEYTAHCVYGTCEGNDVHGKTLRLTVGRKGDNRQLSEAVAMIESDFASFNDHSVFALCNAAFYQYPMGLRNEQFSVPIDP
jgi:hypothetical protein